MSKKMSEPVSKRPKMDNGIELLLAVSNIMTPEQASRRLSELKSNIDTLHQARSKVYSLMVDREFHFLMINFSNKKIDKHILNGMIGCLNEYVGKITAALEKAEKEFDYIEDFFKNE